jgi:FkbM family methyltransferase
MAMYIGFNQIYEKYNSNCNIRGIIHVGACTGEERDAYNSYNIGNVMWFEANPETYDILCDNIKNMSNHIAYNELLADKDDINTEFYITSNYRAASSSMLELGKHLIHYPNITVVKTLKLQTRRFDTFLSHNKNIKILDYNFLNMDVQGAELLVLKGMGNLINNFDYVYSEVNTDEVYKGCCLFDEIEYYLKQYNFIFAEKNMTPFDWGDALFVKQ